MVKCELWSPWLYFQTCANILELPVQCLSHGDLENLVSPGERQPYSQGFEINTVQSRIYA